MLKWGMSMELYLGTSSWTAPSWEGVFYPPGTPASRFLSEYSRHFRTVEIDATFYASPAPTTVDSWYHRTPPNFVFAAKVPQVITHQKVLADCQGDLELFLGAMERLGEKLGPLLFQFKYFRRDEMPNADAFLDRLEPFVDALPGGFPFAVEVRNKGFLVPRLLETLRRRNVALALIDHPYMPRAAEYRRRPELITADFAYIRFLGDRYKIEEITKSFDHLVYDRTRETQEWIETMQDLLPTVQRTYAYYNNHYAGYGVGSVRLFQKLWSGEEPTPPLPVQDVLFETDGEGHPA
jgi:uncharacterized protein YecE (DUF72 family)